MVFLYDGNSWVLQTGCFPPLTIACAAPPLMTQLASSPFFLGSWFLHSIFLRLAGYSHAPLFFYLV